MDDILNNSYFKNNKHHKYSFPKSDRFPHIKSKLSFPDIAIPSIIFKLVHSNPGDQLDLDMAPNMISTRRDPVALGLPSTFQITRCG